MKYFAFILLLSSVTTRVNAQITITKADYLNLERLEANETTDTALNPAVLSPIIGEAGPDQTWDFTKASFNSVKSVGPAYSFLPYSDTILGATDSDFSSATYVEESPTFTYNGMSYPPGNEFYKITDSGAWDLGGCDDSDGMPGSLLSLTPPVEIMPFPLTYQTSWQSTSKQIGPDVSIYNASLTQIEVVDGFGTLLLPNHSDSALRVKETFIVKDSVQGFTAADTEITYIFYTTDGYRAAISASSKGSIIAASYSVPFNSVVIPSLPIASALSLSFTQNPVVAGSTNLLFTLPNASPVQIEIMDVLGRNVRMLENGFESAGEHSIPIEHERLSSGTYFVRILATGQSVMQRLVVQ